MLNNEKEKKILSNMVEAINSIQDEKGLNDLEKISEGIKIGATVAKEKQNDKQKVEKVE